MLQPSTAMNDPTSTADVASSAVSSDVKVTANTNSTKLAAQLANDNVSNIDSGDTKNQNADADSPSSVVGSPVVVNTANVNTNNDAETAATTQNRTTQPSPIITNSNHKTRKQFQPHVQQQHTDLKQSLDGRRAHGGTWMNQRAPVTTSLL
mgnify:CR=1 FL=1